MTLGRRWGVAVRKFFVSLAVLVALCPLAVQAAGPIFKAKVSWRPDFDLPANQNWVFVTMWFDAYEEEIRVSYTADDRFFDSLIASPILACAPAGSNGPQVVDSFAGRADTADIAATLAPLWPKVAPQTPFDFIKSSACGLGINNVASVAAAARARRMYVVFPTEAGDFRGQLWPEELISQGSWGRSGFLAEAKMSGQQVVPGYTESTQRLTVNLSLREGLTTAWYTVPNFGTLAEALSVGLHCAPAGENGPLVATLLTSSGPLTDDDIMPVVDDEVCGVSINNLSSLLEAILQGRLYAVLYTASSPYGEIRGQFNHLSQ